MERGCLRCHDKLGYANRAGGYAGMVPFCFREAKLLLPRSQALRMRHFFRASRQARPVDSGEVQDGPYRG